MMKLKVRNRQTARKTLIKYGVLFDQSLEEVPVGREDIKAFLTCQTLPSIETVVKGGESGHAGIALSSCPAEMREFLFPGVER